MLKKWNSCFNHTPGILCLSLALLLISACQPGAIETPIPVTMTLADTPTQRMSVTPFPSLTEASQLSPTTNITITLMNPTETLQSQASPVEIEADVSLPPTSTSSSTPAQSPTITLTPTKTIRPTRTPYPTNTRRPSRTPTITPTATPPLAYFRINNLGMYSKVISPVRPESIISPGEDGLVHVQILDEQRNYVSNEIFNYSTYLDRHFLIAPEIDFELNGVAQNGRLQILTFDRFERMMGLTSVDLILLSLGENQISAPTDLTEPYIVRFPIVDQEISGGMLEIEGLARILNTNPLVIECVDPDGNILCSDEIQLHASMPGMSHIPFKAFLPYRVSEATNIRLTLRQESNNKIPGTISLFSFEITLLP